MQVWMYSVLRMHAGVSPAPLLWCRSNKVCLTPASALPVRVWRHTRTDRRRLGQSEPAEDLADGLRVSFLAGSR